MKVRMLWAISPKDETEISPRGGIIRLVAALDEATAAASPQHWENVRSRVEDEHGSRYIREATVEVNLDAIRDSFQPVDATPKPPSGIQLPGHPVPGVLPYQKIRLTTYPQVGNVQPVELKTTKRGDTK